MKTSEHTTEIYPAIIALQHKLRPVQRNKVVKTGKYEFRYAPLDSIMEMLQPLFKEHCLALMQAVDQDVLTSRLIHTSGQWVESATHLNREQPNMQAFGGEVTYKRRYALAALIGIVSDDDTDGPRVRATDGSIEGLSDRRRSFIVDMAEIIKDKHSEGNEYGAYEEYVQISDQEERVALWSLLPSKVRTSLTALNKTERDGAK